MLTKAINSVPIQGRMNVIQAGIFNLNMRIVAFARSKLAQANKDNALFAIPDNGNGEDDSSFTTTSGTFQFGKHIDGATTSLERDRSAEGSASVTEEQGHNAVIDPAIAAEQFVSLKDLFLLKYWDECNKTRRRPLDQSYASVINWMHDRDFQPNVAEAAGVLQASKGRVSMAQAVEAQKRRHDDERKRLSKIAEPLLKTMENFGGMDLSSLLETETPNLIDGDVVIDKVFDNMPGLTRLGIANVMWRRCRRLVVDDFPSKRIPTQDFAADIALAIGAEDEFLAVAKTLYNSAEEEYHIRQLSGLPPYDVVIEIERLKKSAAKEGAKSLAHPGQRAA